MGPRKSKPAVIHHPTIVVKNDPELVRKVEQQTKKIEEQQRLSEQQTKKIEEQQRLFEEEVRRNSAMSQKALELKQCIDKLVLEQENLKKSMEQERIIFEQKIKKYEESNAALAIELEKIREELEKENINDLEDLPVAEDARFKKILTLCSQLPPAPLNDWMNGTHIGFLGLTSVGKSTLINKCMGADVCETGYGETTVEIKPYHQENSRFVYWDMPGKNDKINYLSVNYIGTIKAMGFIGIIVQSTTKEMSKMMEIFEFLAIPFCVIVNQMDRVDADVVEGFKSQIRREMEANKLCTSIYFISAKHQSGDWRELVSAIVSTN